MTILVAYATAHGSTREIAQQVGGRLADDGFHTEVRPITDEVDLGRYDAIVVGSAVHGGDWLPEASEFLRTRGAELAGKPTWLFSVSTLGDQESMFPRPVAALLRALRREPAAAVPLRRLLTAHGHRNFAGAVAPADWPRSGRVVFRLMGGRYGDSRNRAAIDEWAHGIGAVLGVRTDDPAAEA
jgi:menaquinone-dependent protoporphyrinogen oxidase